MSGIKFLQSESALKTT